MAKRKTTEQFKVESKKVHKDKYNYRLVTYINCKTKVDIVCPIHGIFKQIPSSHLNGSGCPTCGTKKTADARRLGDKKFITSSKKIHGNKYIYKKVKYKTKHKKVTIICPKHGEFYQSPNNHLKGKGCPACAGNKKLNAQIFKDRAKKIHDDKYIYEKVIYKNNRTKVDIICPFHGVFSQRPVEHLNGRGCSLCGDERVSKFFRKNPTGWSYTDWIEAANNSNNFDSYKVYIIKIKDFYKIGRTFRTIKKRFTKLSLTYKVFLKIESGDGKYICELETKLKNKCKNYSYTPKIEFEGMYECFTSIDPIRPLLIEELLTKKE